MRSQFQGKNTINLITYMLIKLLLEIVTAAKKTNRLILLHLLELYPTKKRPFFFLFFYGIMVKIFVTHVLTFFTMVCA